MLKKLRYKLTLICTIITTIVLMITVMSIFMVNRAQLHTRSKLTLEAQLNTLVYYLQNSYSTTSQTPSIHQDWLAQLEATNHLIVHIEDNHTPLLFKGSYITGAKRQTLINHARTLAQEEFDFNFYAYTTINQTLHTTSFELKTPDKERYLVGVSSFLIHDYNYQIILLQDMRKDDLQLKEQLLFYILFAVIGIMLLTLFSFWFAGHAILPIEESNRKQKEFIAAASHELRSPLAVVQTSASALATMYPTLNTSSFFNAITNECRRMTRLVSDLLLLSHADTHTHWSLELRKVEADTLLLESYDAFCLKAQESGHLLELQFPDAPCPPCLLDVERLSQVLAILIDNALSYTPKGSTITLKLAYLTHELCIEVIDNGFGISDEHKQRVFERFYRIDSARHKKEHSGLGLSIAKEIITLHKGHLSLTDTKPHGCTFTIILPFKPPIC